jgi:anti-sigma B factor antagonist
MNRTPRVLIQRIADVTFVEFLDTRLVEGQQLESIGQELYRLVDEMDRKRLVLNFSRVQFLASAAIGILMKLHQKSAAIGGTCVICGMRKEIMKVFEIMKLTKVLKFAPSEKKALAMVGGTAAS